VAPDFCFILVGGYGKRGHQRTAQNNRKTGALVSRYGIRGARKCPGVCVST
jgi:hypothetical protein